MNPSLEIDFAWWVRVIEVPVLSGLFWLIWRSYRDNNLDAENNRRAIEHGLAQARESLAAYKLEVAKNYASLSYIKDLEARITAHLLRIEEKLDGSKR